MLDDLAPGSSELAELSSEAAEAAHEARALVAVALELQARSKATEAAEAFRQSLARLQIASVLHPESTRLRRALHEIGARLCEDFGCPLPLEDGRYRQDCPVWFSHFRGGLSIVAAARGECSICGENAILCRHEGGEAYDGVIARRVGSRCSICLAEECDHVPGSAYDGVTPVEIMTGFTSVERFDIVSRPENPFCRPTTEYLSKDEVLSLVPAEERARFKFGDSAVLCRHCMSCQGDDRR